MAVFKRMAADVEDAADLMSKGLELIEIIEDRTLDEGELTFMFAEKTDSEEIAKTREKYLVNEIDKIEFEEAIMALNNLKKGVLKKKDRGFPN